MNTTSQSQPAPLVDFDQLQAACDGDKALMRELLDMYFVQADQIVAGLRQALDKQAVDEVDHLAHKLAGSSLACGMTAIVPPVRSMEINAKAGHLNGAPESLSEAVTTLELMRQAVQDYLRQQQGQ